MLSKKKITLFLLVFFILLLLGSKTSSAQILVDKDKPQGDSSSHQIFVKFKKKPSASSLISLKSSLPDALLVGGLSNTDVAMYEVSDNVSGAINKAKANPNVATAFVVPQVSQLKVSNDSLINKQWALVNLKVAGSSESAWDKIDTASTGNVKVAVIDSGVDKSHEDISGKIADSDWIGVSCTSSGCTTNSDGGDVTGHGTHVAGIIGAVTDNAKGIAGVAWNVKLMSVRMLDSDGHGSLAAVLKAIDWAVEHGAKVVNMSIGISEDNISSQAKDLLQQTINTAWEKGTVLVAAAGNCGKTDNNGDEKCAKVDDNGNTTGYSSNPKMYPAASDHVLAVAALDKDNRLAPYSEHGDWVEVAAPGGACSSVSDMENCILSTYPSAFITQPPAPTPNYKPYAYNEGTSMASPQVAGVAALILAKNPSLTNSQTVDIITRTANSQLGGDASKYGGVDALNAVNAISGVTTTPGGPTNTPAATPTIGPSAAPTITPFPRITPWPQNPPRLPKTPPDPYPTGPYCPGG